MDVKVVKVVGKQGNGIWGNVFDFWPDDIEAQQSKGRLVVVGEILVPDEEGAGVGKEFLTRINEIYYSQEGSVSEIIAQTNRKIVEEFEEAEFLMAVVLGDYIYVAGGGVRVWVEGREGWVIDPLGGVSVNSGSVKGKIRNDLKLVMGTKKFWDALPLEVVRTAVMSGDEEREALIVELHKHHGGVGAILQFQNSNNKYQMNDEIVTIEQITENEPNDTVEQDAISTSTGHRLRIKDKILNLKERVKEVVPKERVYVNEIRPGGYKKIILMGVGFLAVFMLVFVAGRIKNREVERRNDVSLQQVEQVVAQYNEAKSLVALNRERSQQLLNGVEEQLGAFSEKQLADERIMLIKQEFGEVLGMASGVMKVEIDTLVDLNLVRDGAFASRLVVDDKGKMFVLDSNGGRTFEVNIQTGAAKVLAGKEELGVATQLAVYPGKYVIVSNKGVVECLNDNQCSTKFEIGDEVGKPVDIRMWAGNIYLLSNSQIWKYSAIESGYGIGKTWLGEGEQISRGVAMAVDGSIWVVDSGRVVKFTGGIREDFQLSGWDETFSDESDLYLDENTTNIYVLDKEKKSVVVFKKSGEYVEQWVNEKFEKATDLVVVESNKKAYFGIENSVYEYKY